MGLDGPAGGPKNILCGGPFSGTLLRRGDFVQTSRISRMLCAAAVAAFVVESASAQVRIGSDSTGGGGIRSGGSLAATPGRVSGMARAGAGSAARPPGIAAAPTTGAAAAARLHPRGYMGRTSTGSGAAQAVPSPVPFPAGFNHDANGGPAPGSAQHRAQVGGPIRPRLITVPRAVGIPPLGNSIPPLEPTEGGRRTARISGHGLPGHQGQNRFRTGLLPHFPVVFVPLGYGPYGGYTEQRIVVVSHETSTHSQTSYQRTPAAPAATQPAVPIESKLYEVRPEEPAPTASGEPPAEPGVESIEMIRGGEVADGATGDGLYLIAFKNESVVISQRHWLNGDTFHYVTPSGQLHQRKLAEVDLDLTAKLNWERGVIFELEVLPENR